MFWLYPVAGRHSGCWEWATGTLPCSENFAGAIDSACCLNKIIEQSSSFSPFKSGCIQFWLVLVSFVQYLPVKYLLHLRHYPVFTYGLLLFHPRILMSATHYFLNQCVSVFVLDENTWLQTVLAFCLFDRGVPIIMWFSSLCSLQDT